MIGGDAHGVHPVPRSEQIVEALHFRVLALHRLVGPITGGGNHQQRTRSEHSRELHVVRVQSKPRDVFAEAAALHMQRDHVHWRGGRNPVVDCRQQECLRAAAGGAGRADAIARDKRERLEKVDRADAVPQLEACEAEAP